jgi:hypothetical protein
MHAKLIIAGSKKYQVFSDWPHSLLWKKDEIFKSKKVEQTNIAAGKDA